MADLLSTCTIKHCEIPELLRYNCRICHQGDDTRNEYGAVAVHHDLSTVQDYFDSVFLINTNRVAEGPVDSTFTTENLQSAYGGRLAGTQIEKLSGVAG